MYCKDEILFHGHSLDDFLATEAAKALAEVDATDAEYLLGVATDDFCAYLMEKYSPELPAVDHDNIDVSHSQANESWQDFGRSGVRQVGLATFHVPLKGDATLVKRQPRRFSTMPPRGTLQEGFGVAEVQMSFVVNQPNSADLEKSFERNLRDFEEYLTWMAEDLRGWKNSFASQVRQKVEQRKKRLADEKGMLGSLKYPLKHRSGGSSQPVPVQRKRVSITRPLAEKKAFAPEPEIGEQEYADVLKTLTDMALVLERSPAAFSEMTEEQLRWHFLVNLNGLYEGQATGETFNGAGKTDILIRVSGGNVFVAECKFWHGEKAFSETIDQLVGYVTWRDTKTAILLFNRNRNLTDVLQKLAKACEQHPLFKRRVATTSKAGTEFHYRFRHRDDGAREFWLAVLVFEVPQTGSSSENR